MPMPETPLNQPLSLDIAHTAVAWGLTQLPELVCLVRSAGNSHDAAAIDHVVNLAQQLYHCQNDLYVQATLEEQMRTAECVHEAARPPDGLAFKFHSLSAFVLATRYYLHRTILCGLLQTIHGFHQHTTVEAVQQAESEDIAAATAIAMCLDYAMRPVSTMALTALAMVIPLQHGLGSWDRLKRRQATTDTLGYRQAVTMEDWFLDKIHHFDLMWRSPHTNHERMKRACHMFAGGPVVDGVCDVRDSALHSAMRDFSA